MNRKIPLYRIYTGIVSSFDKAQSPLFFAELLWAEFCHFYDVVQLRAIQNMADANIFRFVMSTVINMRWVKKYLQKSL